MAQLKLKSIYDWFVDVRFSLYYHLNQSFRKKRKNLNCNKCDTPFQKGSKKYYLKYKGEDKIICDNCYTSAKLKVDKTNLSLAIKQELKVNSPKNTNQPQKSETNNKELDSYSLSIIPSCKTKVLGGEILPANYNGLDSYYEVESINSATLALNRLDSYTEEELIFYASFAFAPLAITLTESVSYGTLAMSDNWSEWSERMQNDLFLFERKAIKFSSPKLFVITGEGWGNFSYWYRRKNDDKITPLQHAIKMFDEALRIEPNNEDAKIGLATLLIERVQVRDLKRALEILQQISNKTDEVLILISKASRWTGNIEFNSDIDYTNFDLTTLTSLREARKRCRHLVRELMKEKDKTDELKDVLDHMYRVAVLHDAATYVFRYCEEYVNPQKYDACYKKLKKATEIIVEYSYQNNGYLVYSNNSFFSDNDYKIYEKIFGRSDKVFNPASLIE